MNLKNKTQTWLIRTAILCAAALACAGTAAADQWNERTILTFSQPVMVPGATLAPGTYVFEIANVKSARHVITVRNQETGQPVATLQAVPTRRLEASPEIVVEFNPTDAGAPAALKAFYYPNERTGHEFVYPEEQARHIAERTRTIVLSSDAPFGEPMSGQLRIYDASGKASPWQGDAETLKSWEAWRNDQASSAPARDDAETRKSTAPAIVRAGTDAMPVDLAELEEDEARFIGKRISVDAAVEDVLGPRAFTIDEPRWFDLDEEILVMMPTTLAALVTEDDRVTITGTMKPMAEVEIDREAGWLFDEAETEIELRDRTVLVADHLVGGDDDRALMIAIGQPDGKAGSGAADASDRPVGTTGVSKDAGATAERTSPIASLDTLVGGREHLVGRHVDLENIRVAEMSDRGGFFVASGDRRLYVLPSTLSVVAPGERVSIDGVVLRMPRTLDRRLDASGQLNDDIYVYAMTVGK